MTIPLGPFALSVHALFELAAYAAGFALLRRAVAGRHDVVDHGTRWTLNVAAILGAVLGSKLVHWATDPAALVAHAGELSFWLSGKSMVGGLVGGTLAVELVKRRCHVAQRTGDVLVLPLIAGVAIGRLGCFAAGLADDTYGTATTLPWGVDFGDGIARHPTQLYEVLFLVLLWLVLRRMPGGREGARFDAFFCAYLAFRVVVDQLKPYPRFPATLAGGLAATQWAALAGLAWRLVFIVRVPRLAAEAHHP